MALTKIINDENKSYRPVLTDKLVLDAKPTVNSFNAITSDAVARAVAGASGEVPAVEEGDNGRVLTAIYDEGGAAVEWADAPGSLPDMTGNDGKILGAVDDEGTMKAQWIDKPEYTAGNGIDIDGNNQISVNHDTTLKDITAYQSINVGTLTSKQYAATPSDVSAALDESGTVDHIKLHIPGDTFSYQGSASEGATIGFGSDQYFNQITHPKAAAVTLSVTSDGLGSVWLDEQDVIIPAPIKGQTWVVNTTTLTNFAFFVLHSGLASTGGIFKAPTNNISAYPIVFGIPDESSPKKLGVANPIPAFDTTTDLGKVLQVTANGLAWVSLT